MEFKVLIKEGCVPTRYMILAETRDWVGHYANWRIYPSVGAFIDKRIEASEKDDFKARLWSTQYTGGQTRPQGYYNNSVARDLECFAELGSSLKTLIVLLTDEKQVLPCDIAQTAGVFNREYLRTKYHWAWVRDDYINITEGVDLMVEAKGLRSITSPYKAVEILFKKAVVPVVDRVPVPLATLYIDDPELYDDEELLVCGSKMGAMLKIKSLSDSAKDYSELVIDPWPHVVAKGTKRHPPIRRTTESLVFRIKRDSRCLELGYKRVKMGRPEITEILVDYYTGKVLDETVIQSGRPEVLYIGTARYHDTRVRTIKNELPLVTVSDPDLPLGATVMEPGEHRRVRIETDWYDDSKVISQTVVYQGKAPTRRVGCLKWPATSSSHVYTLGLDDEATWISIKGYAGGYTLSELFAEVWDKTSPANSVRCTETGWGDLTVRELEIDVTYQTATAIESLMMGLAGVLCSNKRKAEHCMVGALDLERKILAAAETPEAIRTQFSKTTLCIYRKEVSDSQRLILALTSRIPEGAILYSVYKSHWTQDLRELRREMDLGWVRADTADLMDQLAPLHEKMGIELQNDFVPSGRGIYAAYFHGKEPGDGIIKFGRSKDIRQRICKYEQGGGDMPPECEGMMTVLGWVHTDVDGADDDANERVNWCYEDKAKELAKSNGLSLVRSRRNHREYYWCDDPIRAKSLADQILGEIRQMTISEALGMRKASDLVSFCERRNLDTIHFLQHLQGLGVDETYLNDAREIYAKKLAKVQNSD